jgi:SNF2 family DNA or RNA helicase
VETCAIIKWLYPDVFGGKETSMLFKEAFSLGEGKIDPKFIRHVREFLEVIMLRRTKDSDVNLNLPPKKEVVLYAPLTELQRSLYLGVVYGNGLTQLSSFSTNTPSTPTSVNGFDGDTPPSRSPVRVTLNPLMELRKVGRQQNHVAVFSMLIPVDLHAPITLK